MLLHTRVFDLMAAHGYKSNGELARAMGISVAQIGRVRSGKRGINKSFIAGAQKAFPGRSLDELFVVDNEPEHALAS